GTGPVLHRIARAVLQVRGDVGESRAGCNCNRATERQRGNLHVRNSQEDLGDVVYRLLFSLRLTPEMLAPSYTKPLRFHNQKWCFAQHSGTNRLYFRHTPSPDPAAGKQPADVL